MFVVRAEVKLFVRRGYCLAIQEEKMERSQRESAMLTGLFMHSVCAIAVATPHGVKFAILLAWGYDEPGNSFIATSTRPLYAIPSLV